MNSKTRQNILKLIENNRVEYHKYAGTKGVSGFVKTNEIYDCTSENGNSVRLETIIKCSPRGVIFIKTLHINGQLTEQYEYKDCILEVYTTFRNGKEHSFAPRANTDKNINNVLAALRHAINNRHIVSVHAITASKNK